ncbi:MAG: 16S rRNA (uracil(1498)-N(3))-methyltransferase [Pseudomonadota bacterium]
MDGDLDGLALINECGYSDGVMSTPPRLFVKADLTTHAVIALAPDQSNYLFRVMRLEEGDRVRVFNGRDGEWIAKVTTKARGTGILTADAQTRAQTFSCDLHLLFAPLKKARTDFVVEKATELGVSVLHPVVTTRSQSDKVRASRLQRIAEEAAEQTERMDTPLVHETAALSAVLDGWREERALFFCDEAGDDEEAPWGGEDGRAPPMIEALKSRHAGPAAVLIGPEGGFTLEERLHLRKLPFVTPVSLGPRVLRAETAAISALTLWQSMLGDWT